MLNNRHPLQIAVASGKGGTGKTTVAVNMAFALEVPVRLLDCDVEEPNAHLYFDSNIREAQDVSVEVPEIDLSLCQFCGECSRFCRFNALAVGKKTALVFKELCHNCGGCKLVCPHQAIREVPWVIGKKESVTQGNVELVQGCLDIGRVQASPLIRKIRSEASLDYLTIIDCPPGTSCPMIAAVEGSDYVLLVTEPTPFGLNDLRLAVETMRVINIPFGVILNRSRGQGSIIHQYCHVEMIPILLEIPESRGIAEAGSRGELALCQDDNIRQQLREIPGLVQEKLGVLPGKGALL
jgi:MinD superfamily P-loop ATPase